MVRDEDLHTWKICISFPAGTKEITRWRGVIQNSIIKCGKQNEITCSGLRDAELSPHREAKKEQFVLSSQAHNA